MTINVLRTEDIERLIPHRFPFLMIDRVCDLIVGSSCTAYKNVSNNEWFFAGHFPGYKVMPGVLVIESMAQAAAVLAFKTLIDEGVLKECQSEYVYFTSIESAKFKKPIVPGDVLKIEVKVEQRRGNKFWKFDAAAMVDDDITDTCEFRAMIPYV